MLKAELVELLQDHSVEYIEESGEILTHCPYCNHHKPKLSFNPSKEVAKCWVCNTSAPISKALGQLDIELPEDMVEEDNISPELASYLANRGFRNGGAYGSLSSLAKRARIEYLESISTYSKQLKEDVDRYGVISFVYDSPYHGASAVKLRFLDDQKPKYKHIHEKDAPKYYIPDINRFEKDDKLVIVEGEFDAITASYYGYAALASTGVSKQDFLPDIGKFKEVYICFDNDNDSKTVKAVLEARKKLSSAIRNMYPHVTIKVMTLPTVVKDLNEALQAGYQRKDFDRWILEAKEELEGTIARSATFYLDEMVEHLTDDSKASGLPTGIEGIDKALGGGARLGEIDALVAEAKSGKSSLYAQMIYYRLMAGVPVGYLSRELSPASEVIPNLLSIHFGKNFWKLNKLPEDERKQLLAQARDELGSWRGLLYFQAGYGHTSKQEISQFVMECKEKGVNHFYLDHFHYAMLDSESNKEVAKFAKDIKTIVKEENIHLDLIIQPTKLPFDSQRVSYRNMRGSVAIEQAIDQAFVFYRTEEKNITCLELEAARHKLAKSGSKIYFQYDPESTRMTEVEEREEVDVEVDAPGADYRIDN